MSKKIVILGGAGVIGTHLCRRLLAQGHELFCIDRRRAEESPLLRPFRREPLFHYIRHDIARPFTIRCDEIYNLTAPVRRDYTPPRPAEAIRETLLGAMHALDAAREGFARMIYASSSAVYLDTPPQTPSARPDSRTKSVEATTRRTAEQLHRAYREEYGVDVRIARIFNLYGPGSRIDDPRVVMQMMASALQGRDLTIYGSGRQVRSFCWVEDAVDGLMRMMEMPRRTEGALYDLGGSQETSIRQLAEQIIDLTGSPSRIRHIDPRPGDSQRLLPDLAAARLELGWRPRISLREGLEAMAHYVESLLQEALFQPGWVEMNV